MNSLEQQALKELTRNGFQYAYDENGNLCVRLFSKTEASYMENPLTIYVPEKDLSSWLLFATERDQINWLCDEWGLECAENWSKGERTESYENMAKKTAGCISDFKARLMDLHEELKRLQILTGEKAA